MRSILPYINKPARYLGCEYNLPPIKTGEGTLTCALVFPDLYEIGMSHQGLQILYHLLNREKHIAAERCYCPAPEAEQLMRAKGAPLVSLESGRPLNSFDLIGITLPHELCYTNILTVFECAGIPFRACQRQPDHPIILGGGPCSLNPEPVAEFFDAILLGDGEEAIIEITSLLYHLKKKGAGRDEMVERLAAVEGIYLPHLYRPEYDADGRISSLKHDKSTPEKIKRRVLAHLDRIDHLKQPLVPNAKIVHDRLGVEIARGCTRGCRFCQAGITYRPVRERSIEQIMDLAITGIDSTGFDELALLSLSTGDYSCLSEILPRLMNRFADERVSVAMPSMRVGTLTRDLMDEIKKVRKTGFTLAPEAGSDRLRKVINKGISEEDLLETAASAYSLGWNLIKLYFMIGLPTETKEDIEAIVELAKKTARAGKVVERGRRRVTVSIGTFVPKPHTPFQWEPQLTIEQSREQFSYLKREMKDRGLNMKYHDPRQSYLEGVFARGDRRLSDLIIAAWNSGARLDSWSDYFDLELWQHAAKVSRIDLDFYLRRRQIGETLPWQHLDSRVSEAFLIEERDKALEQIYTPDCRYEACQKCGLCDFKQIQPIVRNRKKEPAKPHPARTSSPSSVEGEQENHFKYLVTYSRTGPICYLGHLEFLQIIMRSIRRAGLETNFSKGFNPSPKISFSPALPVGTESLCEFFLMDSPSPIADPEAVVQRLNNAVPQGLSVSSISLHSEKIPQDIVCTYIVELPSNVSDEGKRRIRQFMEQDEFLISRDRKGKTRQLDIRSLISAIDAINDNRIQLKIISRSGAPGIKPQDALEYILGIERGQLLDSRVRKTDWKHLKP